MRTINTPHSAGRCPDPKHGFRCISRRRLHEVERAYTGSRLEADVRDGDSQDGLPIMAVGLNSSRGKGSGQALTVRERPVTQFCMLVNEAIGLVPQQERNHDLLTRKRQSTASTHDRRHPHAPAFAEDVGHLSAHRARVCPVSQALA
jgi:hypothetical protein